MSKNKILLLGIILFNAVSAIGGGIALMNGTISQPEWVVQTDFASLYFPGVILMAIVGGSALIAAIALYKEIIGWQLACILSGVVMMFWILGEIISIRGFHFLQVIYAATGLAIILYTPTYKKVSKHQLN